MCVCGGVCERERKGEWAGMAVEFQIKFGQVGSKCISNWAVTYGADGINETIVEQYVCVCACWCACVRERERGQDTVRKTVRLR